MNLRFNTVKFKTKEQLLRAKQVLIPKEFNSKLIELVGTKLTVNIKCGKHWCSYKGTIVIEDDETIKHTIETYGINGCYFLWIQT